MAKRYNLLNDKVNNLADRDIHLDNNPYKQASRDNYQTYPYDYYTGSDCKIFFGDVWVDDIVTIQYSVNQGKLPIYGYASQTYDAVARGQVTVEGMLTIAFKETGYLNIIQYLIDTQREKATGAIRNMSHNYNNNAKNGKAKYNPRLAGTGTTNFGATSIPSIIREEQTIEDILHGNDNKVSEQLWGRMFGGNVRGKDFEDYAEALEDAIWGDANGNPYSPIKKILRRADEFDYRYDNGTDTGGIRIGKNPITGEDDYSHCLNILLAFGDINDYRAEHTLVALNDIHFTSVNMIVSPSGEPIAESYTFFARDINRSLEDSKNIFNFNPVKFDIGTDSDFVASKLEDLDNIYDLLDGHPEGLLYSIRGISRYDDTLDKWIKYDEYRSPLETFHTRNHLPFADQMIETVEKSFNNNVPMEIFENTSQVILKIKVYNSSNTSSDHASYITMVLEQQIPGGRTYRVISPTRSMFEATSTITRDELWSNVGVENPPKPKDKPAPPAMEKGETITEEIDRRKEKELEELATKIAKSEQVEIEVEEAIKEEEQKQRDAVNEANKREAELDKAITESKYYEQHRQNIQEHDIRQRMENIKPYLNMIDGVEIAKKYGISYDEAVITMLLEAEGGNPLHNRVHRGGLAKGPGLTPIGVVEATRHNKMLQQMYGLTDKETQTMWNEIKPGDELSTKILDRITYLQKNNPEVLFETTAQLIAVNKERERKNNTPTLTYKTIDGQVYTDTAHYGTYGRYVGSGAGRKAAELNYMEAEKYYYDHAKDVFTKKENTNDDTYSDFFNQITTGVVKESVEKVDDELKRKVDKIEPTEVIDNIVDDNLDSLSVQTQRKAQQQIDSAIDKNMKFDPISITKDTWRYFFNSKKE